MSIAAGSLDRRVRIERASVTQHPGSGQDIRTWAEIATVWVAWRRASAREQLAAAELAAQVSDVFIIRWSSAVSDLNPKDRLSFNGRVYDISEVEEIGRREGLRVYASARADL